MGVAIEHSKEWKDQDRTTGRTAVEVTMDCMRQAANSVFSWLCFTMDTPEHHDSQMVPVLDIQMWVRHPGEVEQGLGSDVLSWTFYEKECSMRKVLRASSALTWGSKIVTLGMEVFRRLRNTSRQVCKESRFEIVETFIRKMRRSGYGTAAVQGILTAGITHYYRKLTISLTGGPKLNARHSGKTTDVVNKRRTKMSSSQQWLSRRNGRVKEQTKKEQSWRIKDRREGVAQGEKVLRTRSSGVVPGKTLGEQQDLLQQQEQTQDQDQDKGTRTPSLQWAQPTLTQSGTGESCKKLRMRRSRE